MPSSEQHEILSALRHGYNVQVIALAGTGKTTTASLIAEHRPELSIVVLTYNRNLADESNRVFESYRLTNIKCRTYHEQIGLVATSSEGKRVVCKTDRDVLRVLQQWRHRPPEPMRKHDLLILDETQDMSASRHQALCHMIARDETAPQLVIMGDPHQLVYDYDKYDPADPKFLVHAPTEFGEHGGGREWCTKTLTISYRCTPHMAKFINLFWRTNIVAGNDRSPNVPVEYWVYNHYGEEFTARLKTLLQDEPHGEVVFLNIANLVNKDTGAERPVKKQINQLLSLTDGRGKRMFNFHTKQTDSEERASTKNKIRAWTFAASKGCTFPVVVVFGFSVYKGLLPKMNQVCVALSRASRRLIVVHSASGGVLAPTPQPYMPPLTSKVLRGLVEDGVVVCPNGIPHDQRMPEAPPPQVVRLSVTGLTHLSAKSIEHLLNMGTRRVVVPENGPLQYERLHTFHTGTQSSEEDVSAIYGTAIMFAVEDARTRAIKDVESLLTPLTPESEARFTTDSSCALVRQTLNITLTKAERDVLDKAMNASPSESLSGRELVKLFRQSDFPSLKGHGVRAHKGKDDIFTKSYTKSVWDVYEKTEKTTSDYMYLANASLAFEGTHEVFRQIGQDDYDRWVDVAVFEMAVRRIENTLPTLVEGDSLDFEVPLIVKFEEEVTGPRRIVTGVSGRVDVAYRDTSVEVKFCSCLSDEHELQNLLYAAMNCITYGGEVGVSTLYNSRTEGCMEHRITRTKALQLLEEAARMKAE